MSAAVNGGIVVYYSFDRTPAVPHLRRHQRGLPAVLRHRRPGRAAGRATASGQINPALYALQGSASSGIVDVIHRNITRDVPRLLGQPVAVHGWRAKKGYDLASGLGTVDAAQFVPALANAAGSEPHGTNH